MVKKRFRFNVLSSLSTIIHTVHPLPVPNVLFYVSVYFTPDRLMPKVSEDIAACKASSFCNKDWGVILFVAD